MTDGFYYLAAYTAAVAAGFTPKHAAAIARAARYTEDCRGFTTPEEGKPDDGLLQVVFHYLPGDSTDILAQTRPDFFSEAGAESALALRLVCRPGGGLMKKAADHARKGWSELLTEGQKCQRLGLVAHIVLDACLHLGFAGVNDPAVNGAAGILAAAALPMEGRRELLERTRTEPLAEVFQMEPFQAEPAPRALGCEQVGPLAKIPSAIFSFESPWRKEPLVSCVNPIRCASAYLILRAMFQYVRGSREEWTVEDAEEESVEDLAVFFSGVPDEATMGLEWRLYFDWLPEPPPYVEPQATEEEPYLRHFKYQALELKSLVADSCPDLRAYGRLLAQAKTDGTQDGADPEHTDGGQPPEDSGGQEG